MQSKIIRRLKRNGLPGADGRDVIFAALSRKGCGVCNTYISQKVHEVGRRFPGDIGRKQGPARRGRNVKRKAPLRGPYSALSRYKRFSGGSSRPSPRLFSGEKTHVVLEMGHCFKGSSVLIHFIHVGSCDLSTVHGDSGHIPLRCEVLMQGSGFFNPALY